MRRLVPILSVVLVLMVAGSACFYVLSMPSFVPALPAYTANAANGERIFNAGGCASCHATPKQKDSRRLGGGLALKTAFGTFKVPNISSDPKSGIGGWSEQEFASAMLKGTGRNGEHLYPAFPYTTYQRMQPNDVRDLYAFMKTLAPDAKPSEPHELGFPFTVRRGIGLWKLLYLDGKPFLPDPSKSEQINRGGYLVEALGHCAECHSPRNAIGGIDPDRRFAGGPDPEGDGWVPNITPHPDGIADWSIEDIAYLLETGSTPGSDSVGGSMAGVVLNTARLPAEDRTAMAAYLKSLPPRPGKAPPDK